MRVLRSTNFTDRGTLDFSDVATRYFPSKKAEKFALKKQDLLLERSGGGPTQPVGRIGFITEDLDGYWFSNFVQLLRTDGAKIDPEYLGWVLLELNQSGIVERLQHQTTQMRNLDFRDYLRVYLPIPSPEEQKSIARTLRTANEAIAAAEAKLTAARRLKTALMQQLFTRGIPGRHTVFQQTKIGEIPEGWEIRPLGSLLTSAQYGLSESFGEHGQYQILRMTNIENGYVHLDDPVYLDLDEDTHELFKLEVGDILFNRTNTLELVGRVGIVRQPTNAVFASYVVRLRAKEELIDPFFLNLCLNSYPVQCRYKRFATPAVAQANINPTNLKKTLIAFPPKDKSDEQKESVAMIESVDQVAEATKVELNALELLKRSLLQNLLTGRVRVRVEP